MIKAAGLIGDPPQQMLLIGLSAANTERLLAGQPIMFETAPLGLPQMRVIVVGGATEESIAAELAANGLPAPWPTR